MKGTGETNLHTLIRSMEPELHEGVYVFCSVGEELAGSLAPADVVFCFREEEGITLVVRREVAQKHQLPWSFAASWITLTVHSSLDAVGLTAAFSGALARAGISCNVVAGYYHDHLFVAAEDGQKALSVLQELARNGAPEA